MSRLLEVLARQVRVTIWPAMPTGSEVIAAVGRHRSRSGWGLNPVRRNPGSEHASPRPNARPAAFPGIRSSLDVGWSSTPAVEATPRRCSRAGISAAGEGFVTPRPRGFEDRHTRPEGPTGQRAVAAQRDRPLRPHAAARAPAERTATQESLRRRPHDSGAPGGTVLAAEARAALRARVFPTPRGGEKTRRGYLVSSRGISPACPARKAAPAS